MLKRDQLPAFKKLPYTFDFERINEIVRKMPVQEDDLKVKEGYGDLVGGKTSKLQKAFGLKFTSIEDAYQFLVNNDVAESELYKNDSQELEKAVNASTQLMNEVSMYDYERNIHWFPSVLNMGQLGIIYPMKSLPDQFEMIRRSS